MPSNIEIKDKAKDSTGIKVQTFRKNIRKTNPHKHNSYLELIYLSQGKGSHTIDAETFPIEPPVLFVIRQDQLHFWDITVEPEGFVLILKKEFAEQYFDPELKYLFTQLHQYTKLSEPSQEAPSISHIFHLLEEELKLNTYPDITFLSLLKALLAKVLRTASVSKPQAGSLYASFIQLLISSKNQMNTVSHYAKLLHTTPQNLNAACKKETGKAAAEIIASHVTAEATRLLLYTQLSISEISYLLNFKDNSHFSKYYKKNTGTTPSFLRKHP